MVLYKDSPYTHLRIPYIDKDGSHMIPQYLTMEMVALKTYLDEQSAEMIIDLLARDHGFGNGHNVVLQFLRNDIAQRGAAFTEQLLGGLLAPEASPKALEYALTVLRHMPTPTPQFTTIALETLAAKDWITFGDIASTTLFDINLEKTSYRREGWQDRARQQFLGSSVIDTIIEKFKNEYMTGYICTAITS